MQDEIYYPSVVDFAWQIVNMDREIRNLKAEVERLSEYEQKYNDLLDSSLKHNQTMAGNMLKTLLTPGVVDNLVAGGTFKEEDKP